MFETEIGQIRLPESQIGQQASIGFPVRVRAYSRSENPDPILNNISNHDPKTQTGGKLNNTVEKIWDTHLGTYPRSGCYNLPTYQKFRPRNFYKEGDEHGNKELIRQEIEFMRKLPLKAQIDAGNGHE